MRAFRLLPPLLLGLCTLQAMAATITGVRSWRAPDNTRVVLDLSEPVRYTLASQDDRQVVIELENTELGVALPLLPSHVGLVHEILFQPAGNRKRLVINLSGSVRPQVFVLPANDKYGPRLVIDLFDKVTLEPTQTPEPEEPVTESGENRGRPVIVAIDAGHGGEDPGAIGGAGNHEKDVTLAIARRLAENFRKAPGFRAYLTRDGDYFIPLQDRRKIARNRYKADIFISIHADSAPSPLARGASVFALSRKGANTATSRFAATLADHENKADQIGGVYMPESGDSMLASVLADMVVEGSLSHSLQMGSSILGRLDNLGSLHTRHVEQAGFAVLKEPGMISVLVETGFISNPEEERLLTSMDHQQDVARAVFTGVKSFLEKYPLTGSYFAWNKENRSRKGRRNAIASVVAAKPVEITPPSAEKLLDKPDAIQTALVAAKPPVSEPAQVKVTSDKVSAEKPVSTPADDKGAPKTLPKASLPMSLEDFAGGVPDKAPVVVSTAPATKKVEPRHKPSKPEAKPKQAEVVKPTPEMKAEKPAQSPKAEIKPTETAPAKAAPVKEKAGTAKPEPEIAKPKPAD
ncbi:N-acetylmuramoyl-L-alanine amidase, partial [Fluviicoccus keumensis]|uniref:N-acetylmuramoyl-L-alanine amidase n=1 Tax=Fluviicoccus keumensis TaxID=1435465 RepID=UPI00102BEE26